MKRYYVYIMTNKNHTVLYTGVTGSIEARMFQHRSKEKDSFTKKYNVIKLVFVEEFGSPTEAITAEKKIKGWTRKKKVILIDQHNPEWKDLFDA